MRDVVVTLLACLDASEPARVEIVKKESFRMHFDQLNVSIIIILFVLICRNVRFKNTSTGF